MGVRGLTSYIAKNAERYLKPYELHDCNLVIDGDSLASNLYQWTSQCNSAFGGDYDQYYRAVVEFFTTLHRCNVSAFVLMDGGYQRKKLNTVRQRLRSKIGAVKHIDPTDSFQLFPLMMREVFVEAVRNCGGVHLMRCVFEADDEVAILARRLNCPVLSYDSDFYIHNVQYIPSVTLTMKVLKRKAPRKNRRKPALSKTRGDFKPYSYLDCCVYTIKNLGSGNISDDMLPLFATLLGNDYINSFVFKKFYANLSLKHIGKRNSRQQRRIIAVLRWLRSETLETAMGKVLDRVEKGQREWLRKEIQESMRGYTREDSQAFMFFGLTDEDVRPASDIEEYESDSDKSDSEEENDEDFDASDFSESSEDVAELPEAPEKDEIQEYSPPDWLLRPILRAELPRYITDLLFLKMYINSPQIENFALPESNEIALPILQYIFTRLLQPERPHFQYLTRVQKVSNVQYQTIQCVDQLPEQSTGFFDAFVDFPDKDTIQSTLSTIPDDLKLYFLCLVYFGKRSKLIKPIHIHALLICLCVLNEADRLSKPVIRCEREFQRKHPTFVDAVPSSIADLESQSISNLRKLITKDESILLQRNVLPHFQLNAKIRSRHTEFSSTVVHTFAELQAIIFQMNCLNSLLQKPYESVSVAGIFNGSFLYNMTVALQDRPDVLHYAKNYVYKDCPHFAELHAKLTNALKPFVDCLAVAAPITKKMTRNQKKRIRKQKMYRAEVAFAEHSSDEGKTEIFNDLNNQFSGLMIGV